MEFVRSVLLLGQIQFVRTIHLKIYFINITSVQSLPLEGYENEADISNMYFKEWKF